jgi:glycosyltransferase involved in cell wall biosynthesis
MTRSWHRRSSRFAGDVVRWFRLRPRPVRVTVLIPTFNWSSVLPYSIASVLDQTFGEFELLVVGDGCTDDSEQVVKRLAATDRRVRWLNLVHGTGHQAGPNNEGLRRSRGELIAYLGHDDLWFPRHLEGLVAAIDCGSTVAHSSVLMVNPGQTPFVFPPRGQAADEWLPPSSIMIKADALREVGGWRFPSETGTVDPETDLIGRLAERFGPPMALPTVSAIKLPASYRRDVYRTRPCHEQARWLERIRAAPDNEAIVWDACAEPSEPTIDGDDPVARLAPMMAPSVRAADRQRALRIYKGLENEPGQPLRHDQRR